MTHEQRMAVRTSKQWIAGYPALVAEWHPKKNVDLYPYEVSRGSGRMVWWKCDKGPDHVWSCRAVDRTVHGSGCPFCAGKRASITNCLATKHPEIAREWHPTRNAPLTPRDVTAGSSRRVWWRCRRQSNHAWQAPISNRTNPQTGLYSSERRGAGATRSTGTGCPICSGRMLSSSTSLAAKRPSVAAEWHPTLNGKLTPRQVTVATHRLVWWRCRKDSSHVWRASIANRANAEHPTRCPFCVGRKVSATNNLAACHPDIAAEWHPTRNGKLRACDVIPGTGRVVWWRCKTDPARVWQEPVSKRTRRARGCRFCAASRSASARGPVEAW